MKQTLFALALSGLFALSSQAASFAPANDFYIPADEKSQTGISMGEYFTILDKVQKIHAPLTLKQKGKLVMVDEWENGDANAYTMRNMRNWEIHIFGGLARFETMTPDAFALITCHELGHQLGGKPFKISWAGRPSWATIEGQSDYYASAKCMKLYLADQDNQKHIENIDIPNIVLEKCSEVYSDLEKRAICIRTSIAGEILGNILVKMGRGTGTVSLSTPSTLVVPYTNRTGYPETQCRADTYFQGALCDMDPTIEPSNEDKNTGYCNRADGYTIGARPLCWHKPDYGWF